MTCCQFIPPYLLEAVASSHVDVEVSRCGHATLAIDAGLRARRTTPPPVLHTALPGAVHATEEDAWTVHTAANGSDLPGAPVRSAAEPASGDVAVDEAAAGIEASLDLFATVLGRQSYDGRGAPVIATVHYERNYDNAFWDGRQLVFGDGDGKVFDRFTKPVDVLAHEFTHAVTQYTSGFAYSGQSGALNESISDVFASCVKQRLLGQTAAAADWLIGEGIFLPSVQGRALRSMLAPGTAYDDPVLGKDPQVGSMADYVVTREDNGGVHLNSGIPNRAFALAARALGGASWETAAPIWWAALTSGIGESADFADFAGACVVAARAVSSAAESAVAEAWASVGVVPQGAAGAGAGADKGAGSAPGPGEAGADSGTGAGSGAVTVRRTGGFAGLTRSGEVLLGEDPRTPQVRELLGRIDLEVARGLAAAEGEPQPDRFVYVFCLLGDELCLGEQSLTPELEQLAAVVLATP